MKKDGSKIYWHEIIRSVWRDGKIVQEDYFTATRIEALPILVQTLALLSPLHGLWRLLDGVLLQQELQDRMRFA